MSHPPEDKRPLPEGWIKQFDSNNNAYFYVDTRANPPRSIWVHPLDDPEYQRTHKEKDSAPAYSGYSAPAGPPPSASQSHPELGEHNKSAASKKPQEKRGAFGKLKDKLVGTKEEREAERQAVLARREEDRLRREQMLRERQQRIMQMRQSAPAGYYQQGPGGYYQQAPGGYYQQAPGGYYQQQQQQQGRSGFGGGGMGMGLPILGGLAGGLLLGSALDAGDGGWGGDDGGGDDGGGGDFGGGDF